MGAANLFNNYFINDGKNLAENCIRNINNTIDVFDNLNIETFDGIFLRNVEVSNVQTIINNFKDHTAAGYHRVTVKFLKYISNIIVSLHEHI